MTSPISAFLSIALLVLMTISGLILIRRVAYKPDPLDPLCLAIWSVALPVVISLVFVTLHS